MLGTHRIEETGQARASTAVRVEGQRRGVWQNGGFLQSCHGVACGTWRRLPVKQERGLARQDFMR
jgi:hypothetical protein